MAVATSSRISKKDSKSKASALRQRNFPFGQVSLMSQKEWVKYGLPDRSSPDNPAPDLYLWAVSPNSFTRARNGIFGNVDGYFDEFGYFHFDPGVFFGERLPEFFGGVTQETTALSEFAQSHLYRHPVNQDRFASLIRIPTERIIFPSELSSLGITPMPGMVYIRASRALLAITNEEITQETASRYLGGLYSGEGLFTATIKSHSKLRDSGKAVFTYTPFSGDLDEQEPSGYHVLHLPNNENEGFWHEWVDQDMEGKFPFACFTNRETGNVLPIELGYLYDLEIAYGMRYVHSDSKELEQRGEIVLAFPLRLDVSVFTEMRATLTSHVERIFPLSVYAVDHQQRKSAVDFLLSLTAAGGDRPVNIEIPRGPLKDHLPTHPPIVFDSWVNSDNWMAIQLGLLAHTIGGDRWENVLKLMQGHGTTTLSFL